MDDCNITSMECRLWNTLNENRTLISHITQVCTIPGQISWIMLHFYWKNPAMHQLHASPFIPMVGITKLNLSTLGEGITIIVLNKNPIRDVEMASPGGFRAWQVISLQGRTSAWWPLWSELGAEPSSSISLVFSLQASHLISFNLTFAPGEVFTRFLCHDYHERRKWIKLVFCKEQIPDKSLALESNLFKWYFLD